MGDAPLSCPPFMPTSAVLVPQDQGASCPGSRLLFSGFDPLGHCRPLCPHGGLLRKTLACGEEQNVLGGSRAGGERCKKQGTGMPSAPLEALQLGTGHQGSPRVKEKEGMCGEGVPV